MELDEDIPSEEDQRSQGYLSMDTNESEINISVYLRMSPQDCARLLRQRSGRAIVSSEVLCALLQDGDIRTQLSPSTSSMIVEALVGMARANDNANVAEREEIIDLTSDEEEEEADEPVPHGNHGNFIERRVEGTDGFVMSFFIRAEEGLTTAQIKRLPVYRYNARKHKCEQTSCSICLNSFKTLQFLRRLPCFHQFHRKCVDPWLVEKRKCPTCRIDAKPIDVDASEVETYINSCSQSL